MVYRDPNSPAEQSYRQSSVRGGYGDPVNNHLDMRYIDTPGTAAHMFAQGEAMRAQAVNAANAGGADFGKLGKAMLLVVAGVFGLSILLAIGIAIAAGFADWRKQAEKAEWAAYDSKHHGLVWEELGDLRCASSTCPIYSFAVVGKRPPATLGRGDTVPYLHPYPSRPGAAWARVAYRDAAGKQQAGWVQMSRMTLLSGPGPEN